MTATARLRDARIPTHLAVIPDGNRRWASANGLQDVDGHRQGFEVAKKLSKFCREIGIHTVTLWAFSTENWRRSHVEVAALMKLYEQWLHDLLPEAVEEEVRVIHLGRRKGVPAESLDAARQAGFPGGLPVSLIRAIEEIEDKTASFHRNVINLAINYGGADELNRAVTRMSELASRRHRPIEDFAIEDFLDTAGQPHPNPDLVWRTSGEYRSSGFMPLQSAYSEMVFTSKFFPDLSEDDVFDAVLEYSARIRRFGG